MEGESDPLCSEKKRSFWSWGQGILFGVGTIIALISIAMLAGGWIVAFNYAMKMNLEVEVGSHSYKIWKKTPFPLTLNIYIWNITNHEAFVKGAKPNLQECGPYVWREYHEKKRVSFYENSTVSYMQQRWWIWDEALSGKNSADDLIYSLNPIPLSAAWAVRSNPIATGILNKVFNEEKEPVVVETTVNELLFEGFEDPVLTWLQENVISENGSFHPLLPMLNIPPGLANFEKFGWFYMRNMSENYDGIFSMMTGADDLRNVGRIDMWNYTRKTEYFDPPCNRISGSAGEFFPPRLQRDKIVFYSPDLCMSMSLFYQSDVHRKGLKTYRFWGSNHTFTNGTLVPENECYCVQGTCAPMGLLNAESCRMGAPAFVSFPHYFNADPFLLDQVNGLSPDEEKHAFVMDIMPEAGVPINVNARLQINMRVQPYPGEGILGAGRVEILASVPDLYLPMIWFEELAEVPNDMAKQLQSLQVLASTPAVVICLSLVLLFGLALMTFAVCVCYRRKLKEEDSDDDRYPDSIFSSTTSTS